MKGRNPTKKEKEHMSKVSEFGCIVCRLHYEAFRPCEIHHINGKVKKGAHFDVIGLCFEHHRQGGFEPPFISRHPYKKAFEEAYGSEEYLLQKVKEYVK